MMIDFSFHQHVVKPLLWMCIFTAVLAALVVGLNEVFPNMNTRPEPQLSVVKQNGYTCVKVVGEKASTCTKEQP